MMIGDGLNDILSIQEAGVGVTINAKSEMNLIASDVVALNENLWKIVSLFKLIKYSKIFIYINLLWASIYNIIMLPISAGVFYSLDFTITPTIASVAMSGSSVIVVLFSNFMRCI
jgi:Cu+-exporting ATPase